ncbi:MAG: sulfotransferase [Rhodanobacteraceae bacterium]
MAEDDMPETFNAPISRITSAIELGRLGEAEQLARDHLDRYPGDEMGWNMLGFSILNQRRTLEAIEVYKKAVGRFPGNSLHWNNLGTALRQDGQLPEAEQAYVNALRLQPDNPQYLANMGFLYVEQKKTIAAKELLWKVFELDPSDYEARIHGAQMSLECGDELSALRMLEGWQRWANELESSLHLELASALIRLAQNAEGEALLRAHFDDPGNGDSARARLVMLLERHNRLEEARSLLAQLPSEDTVDDPTLRGEIGEAGVVVLARDENPSIARIQLENLLHRSEDENLRTRAAFLLAKLCDRQNDHAACMEYLRLAHESQMRHMGQLVPELVEPGANVMNIANYRVTGEQFDHWSPVDVPTLEQSPIFVVGFPRSGTTMLEQMLDAHPGMISMDERPFVQRVVERMQSMGLQYPEQLGGLDTAQCDMLRSAYWKEVATVVQLQPGQRLVDKNPLSMLRVPLITRLFPNAKIIFVVRHPCDVVLSCYMQHFNAPAFAALCSSLPRLANGYAHAMRFWFKQTEILKPHLFEWRYESAIDDFEGNVDRLGRFLELDDATPLHHFSEHARNKGYIGTPSYAQVIQPIYKASKGRWQRYREYFVPILPLLEPAMKHWGYDV